MQRAHTIPLTLMLLATLLTSAAIGSPARPARAQGLAATPTATPRADERPDRCEPNNDQRHACRLDLDAISGPFTFLPEGDSDYYSVMIGERPDGLETTITLRATAGLDLYTTIRRADGGDPIAAIAAPEISATLAAEVTGWVVLRVENRGAGIASGQSYRIEVRRTLPPSPGTPTPAPSGPEGLARGPGAPDALENNWSPDTAAPIGVGVLYDLSFVCPVPGGCAGGDHDYLRVDIKGGTRYLLTTFDLAAGVDTVIELLWWSPADGWQVIGANDDARPGVAFLSTLRWQTPSDGWAIVHIGPRAGGLNPILATDDQPTYRFAIALADSPLAAQLEGRIAEQTSAPAPTPPAAASDLAPVSDPGETAAAPAQPAPQATPIAIEVGAATGQAIAIADTEAHTAPDIGSSSLGSVSVDTLVTLTGRTAGLWAEVTSDALVGPAWVDRRALRPAGGPAPTPAASAPDTSDGAVAELGLPSSSNLPTSAEPTALTGGDATITAAPALALPAAPAAPGRVTAQAEVSVRRGDTPLRGVRVMLVTALDEVIGEQITADDGRVVFSTPIAAMTRLYVVIPELGARVALDNPDPNTTPSITVTLPEAQS